PIRVTITPSGATFHVALQVPRAVPSPARAPGHKEQRPRVSIASQARCPPDVAEYEGAINPHSADLRRPSQRGECAREVEPLAAWVWAPSSRVETWGDPRHVGFGAKPPAPRTQFSERRFPFSLTGGWGRCVIGDQGRGLSVWDAIGSCISAFA